MAPTSPNSTRSSPKLMPNLDRHLVYPLLNFSSDEEADQTVEQKKLLLELLKPTNMTDFVGQLHQEVHGLDDMSDEFKTKRDEVLKKRDQLDEATSKISGLLDDENVVTNLRSDKQQNLAYLKESHGVDMDMVNQLLEFGQFQYSCGVYPHAAELLYRFRVLTATRSAKPPGQARLRNPLRKLGLGHGGDQQAQGDHRHTPLQQPSRTAAAPHLVDPLVALPPLQPRSFARNPHRHVLFPAYINTIQTNCPWILRYLSAAVITGRNRGRNSNQYQKQLKDLIRIVRQEGYEYSDPVTDFIKALYIDFDFEEAQKKLSETEEILKNDFFLLGAAEQFVDAARHLISESYCKIHQRIDIKDLSTRLGLSQDEGEKWIVNLIRDTRVDAKIDYQAGTVVMNHPPQSVYQQVIERTREALQDTGS
ncbi:unnamed protein product [Alternaria alternata]